MYEKINYTIVGVFVVIFTSLLLYFAFWLAKSENSTNNFNRYYVYFQESVDGLNKDSTVKLNGVDVGRLYSLKIDISNPSKIEATILISKDIKITKDMYAILKSQGLTGLRYINIVGGVSKEPIKPNTKESIIKSKVSILSKLSSDTPAILDRLANFTDRLNIVLNDENLQKISNTLDNGEKITAKTVVLEDKLIKIVNEFNSTNISNILNIAKDLNSSINKTLKDYRLLAKNGNKSLMILNKRLPNLIKSINKNSKEISKTTYLINKTIKRGDYNLEKILRPAVIDLQELSISYKELSDELKSLIRDPSGAIFNGVSQKRGPGE